MMITQSKAALASSLVLLALTAASCTGDGQSSTDSATEATTTQAPFSGDARPSSTATTSPSSESTPTATTSSPSKTTPTTSPTSETTSTTITTTTSLPAPAGTEEGSIHDLAAAPDDGIPVVASPGLDGVATDLISIPECDVTTPGRTATALSWHAPATGGEQRVDLTAFFRGFESGNFVATPRLSAEQLSYLLFDPEPGAQYEWRVLTRSAEGWVSSEVATFRGAACIVDEA